MLEVLSRASGHVKRVVRKSVVVRLRGMHILFAHFLSLDCVRCLNNARDVEAFVRLYLRGVGSCHFLFFQVDIVRRLSISVLSPLRRTPIYIYIYIYISCVRLSRDVHLFLFEPSRVYVSEAVTLTRCCHGFLSTSNMAPVGGRRRKSAEEQCAELRARGRQTILQTSKKEVENITSNGVVRKWVVTSLRGVRIIFAHLCFWDCARCLNNVRAVEARVSI